MFQIYGICRKHDKYAAIALGSVDFNPKMITFITFSTKICQPLVETVTNYKLYFVACHRFDMGR